MVGAIHRLVVFAGACHAARKPREQLSQCGGGWRLAAQVTISTRGTRPQSHLSLLPRGVLGPGAAKPIRINWCSPSVQFEARAQAHRDDLALAMVRLHSHSSTSRPSSRAFACSRSGPLLTVLRRSAVSQPPAAHVYDGPASTIPQVRVWLCLPVAAVLSYNLYDVARADSPFAEANLVPCHIRVRGNPGTNLRLKGNLGMTATPEHHLKKLQRICVSFLNAFDMMISCGLRPPRADPCDSSSWRHPVTKASVPE